MAEDTVKVKKGGARSAARLGAVQALYQMHLSGETAALVIHEFLQHRLGQEIEGAQYTDADREFFADIVQGVTARLDEINGHISDWLSGEWTLERLELLVLIILRAGIYELIARPDVPTKVIIDEYVDVAHAFFEDTKPSFVNGVLDKVAQHIRMVSS
ncbi:MAG: transcription antitermination factor NusB [Kordiimonas sp.]|nr:transcription antitermination factor NusB [Kordiimonas sp.]|tara:strand:+ start:1354 stop:1827 length:474 start_codon:yes stop_codon:yes gene_type:complete